MGTTNDPDDINICVCTHHKSFHGFHSTCSEPIGITINGEKTTTYCGCTQFISAIRSREENDRTAYIKRVKSRYRCPKCSGHVDGLFHHPAIPWYRRAGCSLGIKKQHIHLICGICCYEWSERTADEILRDIKRSR